MIIFLRFENKHQSRNVINNVKIEGLTYVKTNDILNKLCNFNENLYIKQCINYDIETHLDQIDVSSVLSEKDKKDFEIFPTLKECSEAELRMKNNKSPGIDSLPVEFYKHSLFSNQLRLYLKFTLMNLNYTQYLFLN